ncbi:hypothetical protein [Janibacter hoylei]
MTATEVGWSMARTLCDSARCSRAKRTDNDSAVGSMAKWRVTTPSSRRRLTW